MDRKECSKCNKILSLDNFHKKKRAKDGYARLCKECKKDVNRESYEKRKNATTIKYFKPKPGESLAEKFPSLLKEWDYGNNSISPHDISPGSSALIYWKCEKCKHRWERRVNHRTLSRDNGCPSCYGSMAVPLTISRPDYIEWWDDDRDMKDYSYGSKTIINWKCPNNHKFSKQIKHFKKTCQECNTLNNSLELLYPELAKQISLSSEIRASEVSYNSAKRVIWECKDCSKNWETTVYQRVNSSTGCPHCNHGNTSKPEQELACFVKEIIGNDSLVKTNNKTILKGQELDIYIPHMNIAIEFNGLYWHTEEQGKDRNYHYNKWLKCRELGIQLITVWEDDWSNRKDIVKSFIAHKLGFSDKDRVFARKTQVVELSSLESRVFCDSNHIQGFTSGTYYFGLVDDDGVLVAMSIWRKNKSTLYLDRYCTDRIVVGGMGKLLKHVIRVINDYNADMVNSVNRVSSVCIDKIITFSDNCVSDGGLYDNLGFVREKDLKPDYSYAVNGVRVHKFNYRLSRFRSDADLLYEDGLSESQLAKINNIPRVWDCGKTRWIIKV